VTRARTVEQQPIASWSDVWNFIRSEVSALIGQLNRRDLVLIGVGIAVGILLTIFVSAIWTQLFTSVGEPLVP